MLNGADIADVVTACERTGHLAEHAKLAPAEGPFSRGFLLYASSIILEGTHAARHCGGPRRGAGILPDDRFVHLPP